jgi:hypothetical protein
VGRLVVLRMWVRDMVARWWKTVGLVIPLSLLIGLGSSGVMLSNGVGEWVKAVEDSKGGILWVEARSQYPMG